MTDNILFWLRRRLMSSGFWQLLSSLSNRVLAGVALLSVVLILTTTTLPAQGKSRNATAQAFPRERTISQFESVASFNGPMPAGVTVSQTGRIFVTFPRYGDDPVAFTMAELKNGQAIAYPNAQINRPNFDRPSESLLFVQSAVVDAEDRLWLLDSGLPKLGAPTIPGGPKLVGIDLKQNRVFKTITFPSTVVLASSFLNDVRFDLSRGLAGFAYLSDASFDGKNALIVIDLASGRSFRRLGDHPSTKAEPNFVHIVEGEVLMNRPTQGAATPVRGGVNGITLSADGKRLFYCALSSRRLYSVSTDALIDERMSETQVAQTIVEHGEKGAAGGIESDSLNRIYLTNNEHNAILRRLPNGSFETLVYDPRVLWPDTLSVAKDGYLYFTAAQFHRRAAFHNGKDLRQKPYMLSRVRVDARPILLRADLEQAESKHTQLGGTAPFSLRLREDREK